MTEADPIEEGFRKLIAAHDRLRAASRQASGLGVNEEMALSFLGQGVDAPSELSRAIGMTTAGMTNLLDRLEGDGLLRREAGASDKRRVLLTLTKKGYRTQLRATSVAIGIAQLMEDAPDGEREAVLRFLQRAAEELERLAAATLE